MKVNDKWTVATHDTGTASYQASSLAQTFAAAIRPNSKCFKYGEQTLEGTLPKNGLSCRQT